MGYVDKTSSDGEEYIYRGKFSPVYDWVTWLWIMFSLLPIVFLLSGWLSTKTVGTPYLWLVITCFLLGMVYGLSRYIVKWTTVIAVTSARMIYKTGMIARMTREVDVENIEEIEFHQSFWGRCLNFGVLSVKGEGVGIIDLPPIREPLEFLRRVEGAQADIRIGRAHD